MQRLSLEKVKENLLEYRFIYLLFIFSIAIELIGVYSVEGKFYIVKPQIILIFLFFIALTLFLINKIIGKIIALSLLLFQGFINVIFKMIYVMQGQTVFSISQLKFIQEGTNVVTKYNIDYLLLFNYLIFIGIYLLLILIKRKKSIKQKRKFKFSRLLIKSFLLIFLLSVMSAIMIRIVRDTYYDYDEHPYSIPREYKTYGVTGNFINELFFYKKVPTEKEKDKVFDFLFSGKKDSQGYSKGNNLIIIMVETFEWYSFIQDEELYPNGLKYLTEDELRYLFPNITSFYQESLKMKNYYSKETTIYSENLAILGNHPYKTIPTYDHTFANYEYSLPKMFKKEYPKVVTNYYHNNNITFYGRGGVMNNFGFDNVYGAEKLIEEYKDSLSYSEVELKEGSIANGITDSSMFEAAKEKMFPTDQLFFTYITTLTMHGSYENYRNSLSIYYEKLDSVNKNLFPNSKEGQYFKNYMAAVLNFDEALGTMMNYLEKNNLIDNTTIVLFGDHQAYSNELTYYVRDQTFDNPIVYNVPFMIYDKKLGNNSLDKFSTNIDIVPTIFDIFGIDYYENFYYGNSIFEDEESVSYSYYYNGFLTDKIQFNTLSNTIYISENVNQKYIDEMENKIKFMFKKIKYIDQWYYYYSKYH